MDDIITGDSITFSLPDELSAKEPSEKRGLARDQVRLMVIDRKNGDLIHTRFDRLNDFLKDGDLLVFNSSRTLPSALRGTDTADGHPVEVRLAEHLPDNTWLAFLLYNKMEPMKYAFHEGMIIRFESGLQAVVLSQDVRIPKLWKIRFSASGTNLIDIIYKIGEPICYSYISTPWDLDYYQTVYAKEPGSAEMPSAGRAFTWKMIFNLKTHGIKTCFITLHTGLSSYLDKEFDRKHLIPEEEFFISKSTAQMIHLTHQNGGRVIAVGTTVVKALESALQENGQVKAVHDYTQLHITGQSKLKVVDALLTGLHEEATSHLELLTAFLPASQIKTAYEEAIRLKYLWHEFGDLNLII
jgi:S-adenosylmethionine:tRNA ribosyltransferase-isomerase